MKLFFNQLLSTLSLWGFSVISSPPLMAEEKQDLATFKTKNNYLLSEQAMQTIPAVSQLSDIQPTDWAYEALQSLVVGYGCLVGYPKDTFNGDRALSRWEFAAGLNACLTTIDRLIQDGSVTVKEDRDKLERLTQDFQAELAAVNTRVNNLEVRSAFLENQQFSTTAKLNGSSIFALSDAFVDGFDNQAILQYRHRLLLSASFTGEDNLLIGFYAGNATEVQLGDNVVGVSAGSFALPGVTVERNGIIGQTSTAEGGLNSTTGATTDNGLLMLAAKYSFPVGDKLMVHLNAGRTPYYFYAPVLNGLYTGDEGTGAIGVFGRQDPAYLLVGGGTGIAFNYDLTDSLGLTAGYLADGGTVGDPSQGNGLFNGGYGVLGQLTWNLTDDLAIAAVYTHDYAQGGRFGFNSNGLGSAGTAVANTLAGQDLLGAEAFGLNQEAVVTNGYSGQFSWQPSPSFVVSGWFGTYYPRLINQGDGNILTYALTFGFPDLGKEGNLLGLVLGAEPYLTRMGGNPQPFKVDLPLHIEAFYRYQFNDWISLTPGLIWLTAPNQDNDNSDAVIVTLRTTFTF